MIKITVSEEGIPLVWDSSDWFTLRKDYRIIGNLSGVSYRLPSQDVLGGLPLVLFPYEATLLKEKKIAQLVRYPSLLRAPGKGVKEVYDKYRMRIMNEQVEYLQGHISGEDSYNEGSMSVQVQNTNIINERRSCIPERDLHNIASQRSSTHSENEIHSNIDSLAVCTSVQTFTTYPWLRAEDACSVKWRYPSTSLDVLRFNVYKDLWEKGYYISSGQRFGGDFLVYPGDPYITHAHFLIVCVDKNAVIRPVDIAVLSRLTDAVKKSVVLASETNNNQIIYQSLKCSSQNK